MYDEFTLQDIADYGELPWNCAQPNDCDIMQYTGLRDKDNKETYESDILNYKGEIGVVKFHQQWGAFYFSKALGKNEYGEMVKMYGSHPFYNDSEQYRIIGNVYDNPELLV